MRKHQLLALLCSTFFIAPLLVSCDNLAIIFTSYEKSDTSLKVKTVNNKPDQKDSTAKDAALKREKEMIEARWRKESAGLALDSPEYYELEAKKMESYARLYPTEWSYYSQQARHLRSQAAQARSNSAEKIARDNKYEADLARREQERLAKSQETDRRREEEARTKREQQIQKDKWAEQERKLKVGSPEWYRFKAETYRAQAKWNPSSAHLYNQYADDNLRKAEEAEQSTLEKEVRDKENERNRNEAKRQAQKDKDDRKHQEETRRQQEEDADRQHQEETRRQQAEDADRQRQEETRKQQDEDATRRRQQEQNAGAGGGARYTPGPNVGVIATNAGILELPTTLDQLSWGTVKKAYKKMALKWHPDKHSSETPDERAEAEAKFKEIANAYDFFTDLHDRGQLKD